MYQFDDDHLRVAVLTGKGDTFYYLAEIGKMQPDISIPTLVIHARNDPWIPFRALCGLKTYRPACHAAAAAQRGPRRAGTRLVIPTSWHDRMSECLVSPKCSLKAVPHLRRVGSALLGAAHAVAAEISSAALERRYVLVDV